MKDLKDKYTHLAPGELILDVRTSEEFSESHVPGAKNIAHEDVQKHSAELARYSKIYVHCKSGKRAQYAVDVLTQAGLTNLVLVKDSGMLDWDALGFPVEQD